MITEYTEQQLEENYNRFIGLIKKIFNNNQDRLEKLLHMYSFDELGQELIIAPASGKLHYHNAYPGGYMDHVMNVCKNSLKMKKLYEEGGGIIDFTDEELLFSALHHDLGKLGDGKNPYYIPQENEWHRKNKNEVFSQNGVIQRMNITHRALFLLQHYEIKYTLNEMLGIMLADGMYEEANKDYYVVYGEEYQLKTDLPYIVHWSDHMSCRQENSNYKRTKL